MVWWAQWSHYERFRCCDIRCYIKKTWRRPLCSYDWEGYGWVMSKYADSLRISTHQVAARRLQFQQRVDFSHLWTLCQAYFNKESRNIWIQSSGLGAAPAHSSDLTLAISVCVVVGMKDQSYTHSFKRRARNRVTAEIRRFSKASFTNVWDNSNLLLNYLTNVDGRSSENILK